MLIQLATILLPFAALLTAAAPVQETQSAIGGWEEWPNAWINPAEVDWAHPLHPTPISKRQMTETYDYPPRAAWCSPQGPIAQPTALDCAAYDDALEGWMLDFTDTADPADLPQYTYPPTYCGLC